ncbi:hypothetical protein M231_05179 [Tremella mesenterica]|uniref:Uncharacterized protein n=1 Tax=Tremella mesenterica TaxID=5217 RepID=A0A4Q1BIS0_TREME|nr:hypothetical protein M231_05179 [Tremella mesenterica]
MSDNNNTFRSSKPEESHESSQQSSPADQPGSQWYGFSYSPRFADDHPTGGATENDTTHQSRSEGPGCPGHDEQLEFELVCSLIELGPSGLFLLLTRLSEAQGSQGDAESKSNDYDDQEEEDKKEKDHETVEEQTEAKSTLNTTHGKQEHKDEGDNDDQTL